MKTDAPQLTEADRERVRRILEAAGFPPNEVAWMVESCPSVEVAEEYYGSEWCRPSWRVQ